jgi:hypothetical protein
MCSLPFVIGENSRRPVNKALLSGISFGGTFACLLFGKDAAESLGHARPASGDEITSGHLQSERIREVSSAKETSNTQTYKPQIVTSITVIS